MKSWTLGAALFVEACASAAAAVFAYRLLEWQRVSHEELASSPDAASLMAHLLMQWGVASGCCVGVAISVALSAIERRRELATGPQLERFLWAAAAMPVIVVVATARGL